MINIGYLVVIVLLTGACRKPSVDVDMLSAGHTAMEIVTESKDDGARWRAVRLIGNLKYRPATPLLLKCLSDQSPYVRGNAARALNDMRIAEAKQPLIDLISHETDGGVIQQTTLGLQTFDATEAVPALKVAANHPDAQTRIWVLQAIAKLGSKSEVPFVARFLEDKDPMVQYSAGESLGRMTKQDFGYPKHGGIIGFNGPITNAKNWWKANADKYK